MILLMKDTRFVCMSLRVRFLLVATFPNRKAFESGPIQVEYSTEYGGAKQDYFFGILDEKPDLMVQNKVSCRNIAGKQRENFLRMKTSSVVVQSWWMRPLNQDQVQRTQD